MGIGDKLISLMEERKTNVNELSIKAGISPQTLYSMIKRNSSRIDIDCLIKVSKALGVNPEYFSDLETIPNDKKHQLLIYKFDQLNSEGQEKILSLIDDLISSGRYIKTSSEMVSGE